MLNQYSRGKMYVFVCASSQHCKHCSEAANCSHAVQTFNQGLDFHYGGFATYKLVFASFITATFDFWMHEENTKDLSKYMVKYLPRALGSILLCTNSKLLLSIKKSCAVFSKFVCFLVDWSFFCLFFHFSVSCKNAWILKTLEQIS